MEQSFSDISLYHEYRSARESEHLVSQKTWDDLNLDDFFEWADRTSSCVGRQYLYDVLHYNRLSEIPEQEEVIRKLSADKELRAEIRSELWKHFFTEIVNVFFLREVIPVSKAFFLLQGRQEQIEEVFRYFGLVDMLCSVSELRDGLPYYVLPEACSEGETFHAEGLYHPLIERCIPNGITLCGKSVLVAGSNMSGKTTFIRAIVLNLLSAQVLHTCFARSFRFPMDTALYSAIHLEDSLMEGKSFFLQEV